MQGGGAKRIRHYGDMWGQLRRLMRRCHPKTGELMQPHCNSDGTVWMRGSGIYTNLPSSRTGGDDDADPPVLPEGFYRYEPEAFPNPVPCGGRPIVELSKERRQKIVIKANLKRKTFVHVRLKI